MRIKTIKSFQDYLCYVESEVLLRKKITLFRGQPEDKDLLPQIARENPKLDTTAIEKEMLKDLERRSKLLLSTELKTDWDRLIFAQHFGLKTRLLDWTSNPLIALWFACSNEYRLANESYVYILMADKELLVDIESGETPFKTSKTRIIRPALNNERIIAQSGWFTAHKYSPKAGQFVKLQTNTDIKDSLIKLKIPAKIKGEILNKLSIFGVNHRTIYPDITGLCSHLNWKYSKEIAKAN